MALLAAGDSTSLGKIYEVIGQDNSSGIIIGPRTTSKMGFYGTVPVAQPALTTDASDAASAITVTNYLKNTVLKALGLIAPA